MFLAVVRRDTLRDWLEIHFEFSPMISGSQVITIADYFAWQKVALTYKAP